MTYFDSEIVQIFALGALSGLLLGLVLGWLLRGARSRRAAPPPAAEAPAAAPLEVTPDDAPPAHRAPLTSLPGLSEALARKLNDVGIADVGQLWARAQDDDALLALADDIALEDFALRKWVAIADMSRVEGVSVELANALLRIGVRSSQALAEENPDRVQNKLAGLHADDAPPGPALDRAAVAALIAQAGAV